VIASGSVPGIFPITKLRDWNLIDGGSVWNLNIIGAIDKCKELGITEEENIILDVIIMTPEAIEIIPDGVELHTYGYYQRFKSL